MEYNSNYPNKNGIIFQIIFTRMNIGLRIKEIRLKQKMTQIAFSQEFDIDNSQFSKIENGKLDPTLKLVMEICSKFFISSDWLLFGIGDMQLSDQSKKGETVKLIENEYFFKRFEEIIRENQDLKSEIEQMKSNSGRNVDANPYTKIRKIDEVAEPDSQ